MSNSNYQKILEQYEANYNGGGFHIYYDLKQAGILLNNSYRCMKYKVGEIYSKYQGTDMIGKKGRSYFISHKLLDKFQLQKRNKDRTFTIYSFGWNTNISWTTKDFYSSEYHIELFEKLKERGPETSYIGCVEVDNNGRNHVHLLSNEEPQRLKQVITSLLNEYLDDDRNYRLYCEKVRNRGASVEYLKKHPQVKLNNTNFKF